MKEALAAGRHVIIDRYAFSGVAFSAAKDELSIEWCKGPDRELPKPDLVCFLDVSSDEAQKRGGFGDERYEKREFQSRVRGNYDKLMDETWQKVDTDGKTLDEVYDEVFELIQKCIETQKKPLTQLWPLEKVRV